MRILITNDDGILAPGIEALYRAVADLGDVHVVAPEASQSAMGHGISVLTPMLAHRVHVNNTFHGWSVSGKPADCVKLALLELLDARPDFVLSGINAGANTAHNVYYSGTVAGAVEAAFFGVPSIAFSLQLSDELDFEKAGKIARSIFQEFARRRPAPGTVLSVNIPALDAGWPRGVRICRQGAAAMNEYYRKDVDAHGRAIYWLDGRFPEHDGRPDSDLTALNERYVAITPLRFDLTCDGTLTQVKGWDWPGRFEQ
jgi:5'-nucleotidase